MPIYHQKASKKSNQLAGPFLHKNSSCPAPFKQCPSLHSMLQLKALSVVLCLSLPLRADNIEQLELRMPKRGVHIEASTTHPENNQCIPRKYSISAHMIELDVALTQDQHVILLHDSTIDRQQMEPVRSNFSLKSQLDAESTKIKNLLEQKS